MIKIPNYTITKKIASGGMGVVYLAKHTTLDRTVAIKSLHTHLINNEDLKKREDFRKRFITEAKAHSKLNHPNIVKLIDFQEQEDGLFLIMEYVEGKQLNDYIKKETGPIPEDSLIPIFIKILEAIEYAHSKKFIHRDIKPANILITKDGDVKVIDFGIVKNDEEDSGLTKANEKVGTPSYMSPEQVNGVKIDKLSDIYSLGVTLYEMAVGKPPYEGLTSNFKIQTKIVNEPLPDPKKVYPGISEKLIQIIEKATNKDKKKRYKSCKEFIKAFSKEAKPKPVVKETPKKKVSKTRKNIDTKTSQGIKTDKKNNNKIVIAYGIIFLLMLGIGSYNYFFDNESKIDYREIRNFTLSSNKITENNELKFVIGELSATNEFGKKYLNNSYELIPGDGDTNNSSFNIIRNLLTANKVFDYEKNNFLSLRIKVTNDFGYSFEKTFSIEILDDLSDNESSEINVSPETNTMTSSNNSTSDSQVNRDNLRIAEEERIKAEEDSRIAEQERLRAERDARLAEEERVKAEEERFSIFNGIIKSKGFNSAYNYNNNKPVSKAKIYYQDKILDETNANGKFNFDTRDFNINKNEFRIKIEKNGFISEEITLRKRNTNNNEIYISKINLIKGELKRRNGRPAKNITVIASKEKAKTNAQNDPNKITTKTNNEGIYRINIDGCFDCIYIHFINSKDETCGGSKLISSNNIGTKSCN